MIRRSYGGPGLRTAAVSRLSGDLATSFNAATVPGLQPGQERGAAGAGERPQTGQTGHGKAPKGKDGPAR